MSIRRFTAALLLGSLLGLATPAQAQQEGMAARHRSFRATATAFLKDAAPGARKLFAEPGSRAGLIALGAVLERTKISRDLLKKTINNPHAYARREGWGDPMILPAIKALARLGDISGAREVLERSAKSHKDEGSTRGALFEFVAGSAVKRMGYKLDGLSFQIGKYETDGVVEKKGGQPTFVNMKSISSQKVLKRVTDKAADQLRKRNGTKAGRDGKLRNPALLVIGKGAKVHLSRFDWASVAKRSGADLTVISVDPQTARGKVIFRRGVNQRLRRWMRHRLPTTSRLRAQAKRRASR